ncbi:proteasomal ubiquitin receptor ADRM1-like isoform X2 [Corticium candelabrum]|uniref:proteasomal ubiquitin receptor ADRM1-like isoform X2 n=1 Tax=Corticium candelabrum TaxID=121492 RepID=UPI002E258922|nr:proteasomal ubiquitin receptor ADRM1-like isoform X2 [Corticium candelabrum]
MAFFGHGGGSRGVGGGQKNLVEFRAGKLNLKGRMLYADKRKGLVYVQRRSEEGLMHFCWKDRTTGVLEDDLFLFPEDAEFKRLPQCTTGRAYILKFKTSNRRLFFWMQEPKADKDDEFCHKVNEALNNPDAAVAAAMAEEGGGGMRGLPSNLASALAGQLGNSNLANLVGNMDQQQLLQLLGGGAGGYADLATLAGLTGSPPSSAPSSAGGRSRESATPATGQPSAITSAASLQTPATMASHVQPNALSRHAMMASADSSSFSSSQSQPARVQLSDLQKALQSVSGASAEKETQLEMSHVLSSEAARQLLSHPVVRQRLQPFMPEGLGQDEESMTEVVNSPQFQQALRMFGTALQTGQLGPVVGQFNISESARMAAVEGESWYR